MQTFAKRTVLRLLALLAPAVASSFSSPASARDETREFAACLVKADPSRMEAWIKYHGPGLIYKEVEQVSHATNCQFDGPLEYWTFRGLLAEELVAPDLYSGVLPDLSKIEAPTDVLMAQRWGNNDGRISMLLNVFAECEAKTNTAGVFALLRSAPRSDEEKRLNATLVQRKDECSQASEDVASKKPASLIRPRLALAVYEFLSEIRKAGHA